MKTVTILGRKIEADSYKALREALEDGEFLNAEFGDTGDTKKGQAAIDDAYHELTELERTEKEGS